MEMTTRERRREETNEEASPKPYNLPREIIGEILIRLPAKSIGRFRSVSKLFRSLSSDQRFAKSHIDLTIRNDSVQRKLLLYYFHSLYTLDLDSISDNAWEGARDLIAVELNYPFELSAKSNRRNSFEIIGSCNGLVCLSPSEDAMFLYNPTTGESKRVHVIEPRRSRYYYYEFRTYGFGFDDLTNDYKVVMLDNGYDDVLDARVYSLKSDSWRWIRDLRYTFKDKWNSGVNLNGACHWVFTLHDARGDHCQKVVLAFDIKAEEFREMSLPDEAEYCSHGCERLVVGNLKGRLCLVNHCNSLHDDLWVMNEYGVASSWSKIQISLFNRWMKPLCATKNNEEVLLKLDGDMVLYNFELNAYRKLEIRSGEILGGWFKANTYVESLVSPNSFGVEN